MTTRPGPETRPRYARIGLLAGAVLVTLVTVLGGLGVLPDGGDPAYADGPAEAGMSLATDAAPERSAASKQDAAPSAPARGTPGSDSEAGSGAEAGPASDDPAPDPATADGSDRSASRRLAVAGERLPADSGEGRRVVFDMSAQRVWLVGRGPDQADRVRRTYLVSGSLTDNLAPGGYTVYSRSARAWGVDDSGSMEFMVRFARGERAAIGFHSIPVKDGLPVQSEDQLGTPQSHGCIRQARPDAKALWDFAPVGTPVVVTA